MPPKLRIKCSYFLKAHLGYVTIKNFQICHPQISWHELKVIQRIIFLSHGVNGPSQTCNFLLPSMSHITTVCYYSMLSHTQYFHVDTCIIRLFLPYLLLRLFPLSYNPSRKFSSSSSTGSLASLLLPPSSLLTYCKKALHFPFSSLHAPSK